MITGDQMKRKIFITGGAGYIGSHTCVEILNNSHEVLVYDNLSNGSFDALRRVQQITNKRVAFINGDILNLRDLSDAMHSFKPDVVLHFAGLKSVRDSVLYPLNYYDVNVVGTINLLNAMDQVRCENIVFSSSATVYGEAQYLPYDLSHPLNPTNPYGQTKLVSEQILRDWCTAGVSKRAICLRYFNPIGAHESGLIGESPLNMPNNLMPLLAQVAVGAREELLIFGNDYLTKDGTGERDYIHVVDLAVGHVKAVEFITKSEKYQVFNLGTGHSVSVLQLIEAFEKVSGKKIKYKFVNRRKGDVAKSWADPTIAETKLGIKFKRDIIDMCSDTWRWQNKNPAGYID